MTKIYAVTFENDTNTIEVSITDKAMDTKGNVITVTRVSCRNFPKEQKSEYLAQFSGGDGLQYIPPMALAAGW